MVACGEDYGETNPAPGSSTSSGGGSSTGSGSGSSSSGTNPAQNGRTLGATPGKIECGKETCDLAAQKCCVAGANDLKCQAKDQACPSNSGTATCDDAADCADPNKKKCCGSSQGFNKSTTQCTAKCDAINEAQSCLTNEECGGQDCVRQSCFGFTSFLCGLNTFCKPL